MSEDRSQDGWEALFGTERAPDAHPAGRPPSPDSDLRQYLELPGVRGVVSVALGGLVLGQAGEVDGEGHGALTAFLGASGGQLGQTLHMGGLQYAVLTLAGERSPLLVLRLAEGFLGLLLEPDISPTHVIARLPQGGSAR